MRRLTGAVVAASALAVVLPLTVAAPAGAATAATGDRAGDVWDLGNDPNDPAAGTPSDHTANVDVRRYAIRHTDRRVVMTTTFGSLTKSAGYTYGITQLYSSDRVYYQTTAYVGPGARGGVFELRTPDNATVVECGGATVSPDYRDDTLTVSVPRSCLGRSAGYRWRSFAYLVLLDDSGAVSQSYRDAVGTTESTNDYAPRVNRG